MSGGFFRGTSTDQDTRFSNKKAKLLKSQKFALELETLVDMTKVKMDVMRPWIAKRVTELIGFEDEVLINFIYGLLEGKDVNGKEVQISLTGFMERNTGKFMKELWLLLLSAQQNLSGVPQQFLDAKEEETKKKKAETDRIANEIHKKREKERQELEQEKTNTDGVGEMRDKHTEAELNLKPDPRLSSIQPVDEQEQNERKHLRGRGRVSRSPDLAYRSSSPRRKHSSPKSFSNSRSYSHERQRSRSISKSPPSRSGSDSSERRYSTSPRRSLTPRRRYAVWHSPSPSRHRSSHSKWRSGTHSRRRSPSPTRYRVRSPWRRRSRSPRRWSRSPIRTSPARRRSPSPMRRRSPSPVRRRSLSSMGGRSPSPVRYRTPSPLSRRLPSPRHRRSPSPRHRSTPSPRHRRSRSPWRRRPQSLRHHSPSPVIRRYQQSPSITRQQSMSPVNRSSSMLGRKRSITPALRRSSSPQESSSRSPIRNSSLSPVRKGSPKSTRSPPLFPRERVRSHEKHSRARSVSPRERAENSAKNHQESKPVDRKPIISLRSPQRDMLDRNDSRVKGPASSLSMQKSAFVSDASRERGYSEDRRSSSPRGSLHQTRERLIRPESPSPVLKTAVPKPRHDNSGTSADDEIFSTREVRDNKYRSSGKVSPTPDRSKDFIKSAKVHILDGGSKARKSQPTNSDKLFDRVNHKEREQHELSATHKTTSRNDKGRESNVDEGNKTCDKNSAQACRVQEPELPKLLRKSELNERNGSMGSPSKETDEHKTKVKEKRKHEKSDRHEVESDDYSSYDSYEERKEAKRRRKEEKRLKKEERHRRRDDRRRRKEERRAEKRKLKSTNAGSPPSDLERDHSEDESYRRQKSRSDNQEAKSEQKNLEIALREKALESLRAKKGIGN